MPKKKSPENLQLSCIRTVAQILYQLNTIENEDTDQWLIEFEENKPFACYPGWIIEELLWALGKLTKYKSKNTVRKELLYQLLCRRLTQIDLSQVPIDRNDFSDILMMIIPYASDILNLRIDFKFLRFCTKTELLRVLGTNDASNKMLKLALSITNVTELCVDCICFDEFLEMIGRCCPNLIALEAASELVTDVGLKCLCQSDSKDNNVGRCQQLRKISLLQEAEGITTNGVKTLLKSLPNLTHMYGYNLGNVMQDLFRETPSGSNETYRLEYFKYDGFENSLNIPEIVVNLCPFITCLVLIEASDDTLVKFGSLRHLTVLIITTSRNRTSFANGVLPLIRRAGSKVESLHLCLDVIDLSAINRYCPILKRLFCFNVQEVIESGIFADAPFQHLETISFHAKFFITLSPNTIRMLLSHCLNLENLTILRCSNLTDPLLQEILQRNPLKKLKKLNLTDVDGITLAGVEIFLNQESDLFHISLPGASEDDEEFLRLQDLIKEKNLDLVLDRYFY